MPTDFCGEWIPKENQNFDEYMKQLGAGPHRIKAVKKSNVFIDQLGNHMLLIYKGNVFSTYVDRFTVGALAEKKDIFGRRIKILASWDGNRLRTEVIYVDKKLIGTMKEVVVRELVMGELVETHILECQGGCFQTVRKFTKKFKKVKFPPY